MIRTESEYKVMVERLNDDLEFMAKQKVALQEMGLSAEEVHRAMEPSMAFHEQLKEEVEYYERIKRFDFGALENFVGLGRYLIGLRIALGISQSELANRLNVSLAQISKDEKNEYHGISVEKAQRVLDALDVTVITKLERLPEKVASC
ncbi:MAG: helix-turn-helix domain-containing protein [Syntrophomonadaceae bacterium]|jgi:DNA-binding XRE family transcriptional regulator